MLIQSSANLNELTGAKASEKHGPAAPGEQMRSVITSDKLYSRFNWKPGVAIKAGLKSTVDYFRETAIPV